MKNLQINTLKTHWPMVATTNKNVYLCPEIIEEMNKESLLNEPNNEELKPYTMEEINAMLEESERDFEAGRIFTTKEVIDYCKKELAKLDKQ